MAIELEATDRDRLLHDVLEVVYTQARLHTVEAGSYSDGMADISLRLSVDSWGALAEMHRLLEHIANVHQVRAFPVSARPLQRSQARKSSQNP